MNKIREADIQKAIMGWLKAKGYFTWRNYVGPILRGNGIPSPNPMAGMPDICGILKNQPGRLFAIEVKTSTGKLSPKQEAWIAQARAAGVLAFVARDLKTVEETLEHEDV